MAKSNFQLDFQGTKFTVPKASLFNLFEHRQDLFVKTRYEVQSAVPLNVFEEFVKALETGTKLTVTNENAASLSLLAKEFWLSDCLDLEAVSAREFETALSGRISTLESQLFSGPLAIIPELKASVSTLSERISTIEHQLSFQTMITIPELQKSMAQLEFPAPGKKAKSITPPAEIADLTDSILSFQDELEKVKSKCQSQFDQLGSRLEAVELGFSLPISSVSASRSLKSVQFPFKDDSLLDGIISYLTRKCGGNVHENDVVTITSSSVYPGEPGDSVSRVADLTSDSFFASNINRNQWVCWDFLEMRVRPTHYTIRAQLRNWMIETSVDAQAWTGIDRQADNRVLDNVFHMAAFPILIAIEFRYIRIIQTGTNLKNNDLLGIWAFELFGTLLE
jgi:hypothetical protein